MYYVTKTDGTGVALIDEVRFIKENLNTHTFLEADEQTAQGVLVNGLPCNLVGRVPMTGILGTVSLTAVSEEQAEQIKAQVSRDEALFAHQGYLADTDYIVFKIAEALADGDADEVARLQNLYTPELTKRQQTRTQIGELQTEKDRAAEALGAVLYPAYEVGKVYNKGDFFTRGVYAAGNPQLYKVLQTHISQADWTPEGTPALYCALGATPAPGGYPEWRQPTGAHDAYNKGDIVDHKGALYRSIVDGNVWEPGTVAGVWESYEE